VAELELRTPTRDDAATIAELCDTLSRDLYGEGDVDERSVREWFAIPDLAMVVAERGGRVAGYADVRRDAEGTRFPIDLRVHPDARGTSVAEALLDAAEAWADGASLPGALLRAFVAERDTESRDMLERRGYRLIRHSFTMQIDLPELVEPPEWPDGISVRTYDPAHDEEAVYECTQEAFADHWDYLRIPIDHWRAFAVERESFVPELWWLAEDGDELAGVSLNAWHYSGDPSFGWVGTLCVRRPWRRRGLGLALLRQSFLDFHRRGATRVGLGVDAENTTGAVRLYERAGMRPVRRNDTYERAL
jgi:mycothiol synthase